MKASELSAPLDVPVAEFSAATHRVVDWIARYLEEPERFPVLARVAPGEISGKIPLRAPREGESLETILDDFEQLLLPGITHWNHPGFFAYFSISASAPGIVAELLMAALDTNAMLWKTSPSATELELRVVDWLRELMGLGSGWFGLINDTASISTMLALAAAREAKPELEIRTRGLAGRSDLPVLRVYTSAHAHSSVDKGAITLGFGHDNVVHIGVDQQFRMRADLLAQAIAEDKARGMLPIAVVATVGTTAVASVDPVPAIAEICRREGVWLHVDASYAGVASIVPEARWTMDGVDLADSLVVNPHKWLFVPVDCSTMFTRHPEVLKRAFSLVPEYLVTAEQDQVVNLMDYGVQLGRRFRALKLWMVIRAFGAEGLIERLRAHLAMAQELASMIEADPDWDLFAPVLFSLVCMRYAPAGMSEAEIEQINARMLERVNASGEVFLSHTKIDGKYTLRLAIGNIRTEMRHVRCAWELLNEAARSLSSGHGS